MTYRDASDSTKITMSFQALGKHGRLIHEAARLAGENASTYMRRLVLMCAAADLGITIDLNDYTGPDLVAQAAKKLGLSPRDFTQQAAIEKASEELGLTERIQRSTEAIERLRRDVDRASRPPGESGERKAAPMRKAR